MYKKEKKLLCFPDYHEEIKAFSAFSKLLKCREEDTVINKQLCPIKRQLNELSYLYKYDKSMTAEDYESIMNYENTQFLNHLQHKSIHYKTNKESYHFMGLQRWNSQTPALALSQGGGYLIYRKDKEGKINLGIVIDPGFDFIDNLFHSGFTLCDIDFILISHAHLDHMRDFEPLISLLLDLKKREKKGKKFHVFMTMGVYIKLKDVITNPTLREYLADTYIIDINKAINKKSPGHKEFRFKKENDKYVSIIPQDGKSNDSEIQIQPTNAYHDDYSDISDSFGYIVKFKEKDNNKPFLSFGYTGDTKWIGEEMWSEEKEEYECFNKLSEQYNECDVICIHMGALIQSDKKEQFKKYYKCDECNKLIEKKGHPYLFGLLRFIKDVKSWNKNKTLLLISEFGEELKGGIRIDFIKKLNELISNNNVIGNHDVFCLPVDIGLDVLMYESNDIEREDKNNNRLKVFCCGCDKFVSANDIKYKHYGYGHDEALFYFCSTCLKSKPENVLMEKMRKICEFGVPLKKE